MLPPELENNCLLILSVKCFVQDSKYIFKAVHRSKPTTSGQSEENLQSTQRVTVGLCFLNYFCTFPQCLRTVNVLVQL